MLNCNVVIDLMPSYIDGLVSDDTAKEVDEHLAACAECRNAYNEMKADIAPIIDRVEEEIDYLKKIKRKGTVKALRYASVSVAFVAVALIVGAYFFAVGTPVESNELSYTTHTPDASTLLVEMALETDSALVVRSNVVYDDETGRIKEIILTPRQISKLIGGGSEYSYGYSTDGVMPDNLQIIVRFSDQDVVLNAADIFVKTQ